MWEESQPTIWKRGAAAAVKATIRQTCHCSSPTKQAIGVMEMNDKAQADDHRHGEEWTEVNDECARGGACG